MPIPTRSSEANAEFVPMAEGQHSVVCVDVIDHGPVTSSFNGEEKVQYKVSFVFINREGLSVRKYLTNSVYENAWLPKFLAAWVGKRLTPEQLKTLDLEKLIGRSAIVQVEHGVSKKNGMTYANVGSIMALPKGIEAVAMPADYVRIQDRPPREEKPNGTPAPTVRPAPTAVDHASRVMNKIEQQFEEEDSGLPF